MLRHTWVVALVLLAGCESRISLGGQCTTQAECPTTLTCTVGRCREACTSAVECGAGRRCLQGSDGVRACSTSTDDSCTRVEDCGDSSFSLCVNARCQTRCVEDAECAGGVCVLGGCAEQPAVDATVVSEAAFGPTAPRSTARVGSFVIVDPDAPDRPLALTWDEGLADIGVVVEDASSGGVWVTHVATMQRRRLATERLDLGVPIVIDVDHVAATASRTALRFLAGANAATVAAEPMPDGNPAYLWLVNDPFASTDAMGVFAYFARTEDTATMGNGDNMTQRLPGRAFLARGHGALQDGPAYGLRVVDDGVSEIQVTGPGAGMDVSRVALEASDRGRVDAVGSLRSFIVRSGDGVVRFVRLEGDEMIASAAFELAERSTCAPGLTDRSVVADGNYLIATCSGAQISLLDVSCPTGDGALLDRCSIGPRWNIAEQASVEAASLETWPGGVMLVTEDADGLHARAIADAAGSSERTLRYDAILPSSYRVNAFTDFRLTHWAANTAWRDDAAILVIAGFYLDDNEVAQLRVGVVEVTAD